MGKQKQPEKIRELEVISLGAGVQSSVLCLLAAKGITKPMPDFAIFADTGWEPPEVTKWLEVLKTLVPFPVHVVSGGDLRQDTIDAAKNKSRVASAPFFTYDKSGGRPAIIRRQCTDTYKLIPIKKRIRELLGVKKGARVKGTMVTQQIGISLDEVQRMAESRDKWITLRWPLIDLGMSRHDCLRWMKEHGYPEPPKSACVGCPYHNDEKWRDMKLNQPEQFADAVEFDKEIRAGFGNSNSQLFVHRSLQPLGEVDFSNDIDNGQMNWLGEATGGELECSGNCFL